MGDLLGKKPSKPSKSSDKKGKEVKDENKPKPTEGIIKSNEYGEVYFDNDEGKYFVYLTYNDPNQDKNGNIDKSDSFDTEAEAIEFFDKETSKADGSYYKKAAGQDSSSEQDSEQAPIKPIDTAKGDISKELAEIKTIKFQKKGDAEKFIDIMSSISSKGYEVKAFLVQTGMMGKYGKMNLDIEGEERKFIVVQETEMNTKELVEKINNLC